MALAVPIELTGIDVVTRSCADGNQISKGSIVWLTKTGTNLISSAALYTPAGFGGITVADKVKDDGSTTIGCDMGGAWDVLCDGTIPTGAAAVISGANAVGGENIAAAAYISAGAIIGYFEEPGVNAATVRVRLRGI